MRVWLARLGTKYKSSTAREEMAPWEVRRECSIGDAKTEPDFDEYQGGKEEGTQA